MGVVDSTVQAVSGSSVSVAHARRLTVNPGSLEVPVIAPLQYVSCLTHLGVVTPYLKGLAQGKGKLPGHLGTVTFSSGTLAGHEGLYLAPALDYNFRVIEPGKNGVEQGYRRGSVYLKLHSPCDPAVDIVDEADASGRPRVNADNRDDLLLDHISPQSSICSWMSESVSGR